MNDTHPDIAMRVRDLIMSKSGEERLLMGFSMYDAAREIVRSAILAEHPDMTPQDMRKEVFLRFYGQEFSQADREKILAALASHVSGSGPHRV